MRAYHEAAAARGTDVELTDCTASELSARIAARAVSCEEVMAAFLDRIERLDGTHGAIVALRDADALLDEARVADAALRRDGPVGWLHGIPHGVKDLADARSLPTTFGSPLFVDNVPAADSLHVARIRAAGAIIVGKTNVPEFGLGSQTYNRVHGTTRNARDPALTAGGSSGGAAVALATGMLPAADGSDMMGSLRNPAAFNGIVGFRPSQGRVPSVPTADGFYQQLAVNGPLGRSVEDVVRMLCTMAGPDRRFPLGSADPLPPPESFRPRPLEGLRIGWLGDLSGHLATEPGVLDCCTNALAELASLGCVVEEDLPDFDLAELWACWLVLRHFGVLRHHGLHEDPAKRAELKPELCWEIEQGLALSAQDVVDAGATRTRWFDALTRLFDGRDLLALPAAQVFPFPAEQHWPEVVGGRAMDTYHRWMEVTIPATLAGAPALSLPAGCDDRGRPMGLQVIGRPGEDRAVLEFALAWERALPGRVALPSTLG